MILALAVLLGCVPETRPAPDSAGQDTDPGSQDTGWQDGLEAIQPGDLPAGPTPCREPELVVVSWVVDGDTFHAATSQGDESVRVIGIDTPEVGDHEECFGDEAWAFAESVLEGGRAWLSFDDECLDAYDRTLAYVHTGLSEDGFYERLALKGGYATVLTIEPNSTFAGTFRSDEDQARRAGAGLWGACR